MLDDRWWHRPSPIGGSRQSSEGPKHRQPRVGGNLTPESLIDEQRHATEFFGQRNGLRLAGMEAKQAQLRDPTFVGDDDTADPLGLHRLGEEQRAGRLRPAGHLLYHRTGGDDLVEDRGQGAELIDAGQPDQRGSVRDDERGGRRRAVLRSSRHAASSYTP